MKNSGIAVGQTKWSCVLVNNGTKNHLNHQIVYVTLLNKNVKLCATPYLLKAHRINYPP